MSIVSHIRYIDEYNKQRALLTDSYPSFVCTAACNAIVEEEIAKLRAELEPKWVTDRDPDEHNWYLVTCEGGFVTSACWIDWRFKGVGEVIAWAAMPKPYTPPAPKQTTMWLGKDAPELEGEL